MTSGGQSKDQNAGTSGQLAPASRQRPDLPKAYVAPRTTLQEVLVSVWAGILGTDKIGIEDDFFELGRRFRTGHASRFSVARYVSDGFASDRVVRSPYHRDAGHIYDRERSTARPG